MHPIRGQPHEDGDPKTDRRYHGEHQEADQHIVDGAGPHALRRHPFFPQSASRRGKRGTAPHYTPPGIWIYIERTAAAARLCRARATFIALSLRSSLPVINSTRPSPAATTVVARTWDYFPQHHVAVREVRLGDHTVLPTAVSHLISISRDGNALNGSSKASAPVGSGSGRSCASAAVVVSFLSRATRDLSEQRLGGIASPLVFLRCHLRHVWKPLRPRIPRRDDPRPGNGRRLCRRCWSRLRFLRADNPVRDLDRMLPLGWAPIPVGCPDDR